MSRQRPESLLDLPAVACCFTVRLTDLSSPLSYTHRHLLGPQLAYNSSGAQIIFRQIHFVWEKSSNRDPAHKSHVMIGVEHAEVGSTGGGIGIVYWVAVGIPGQLGGGGGVPHETYPANGGGGPTFFPTALPSIPPQNQVPYRSS